MRISWTKLAAVGLLVICLCWPGQAKASQGNLEAERVKYYRQQQLVKAFGNVHLKTEEVNLWADRMKINLKTNQLLARGNVKSADRLGEFSGEKLRYNLKQGRGIFIDSEGIIIDDSLQAPMYIKSPKTSYAPEKTKLITPQFTTCNYSPGHYHFQAAEMIIKPEDKIIAYHVTFWEFNGRVPLFYTPIWIYSLKDRHNRLQTEWGRSEQKGWFVKNTYNYRTANKLTAPCLTSLEGKFGQLYVDYFTKLGVSVGFKHYYRTLKNDQAYLYFYAEQDKRNPQPSPWITVKINRKINKKQVDRSYKLTYKDHTGSYLSQPKTVNWWEFDYDQSLNQKGWERDWKVDYKKNESYQHNLDLKFDLTQFDWEQDELEFDLDYFLTDKKAVRTDEYKTKLHYKKYFTKELYLAYNYNYNYKQEQYNQQGEDTDWDYDLSLTLGEEKGIYDWSLITKTARTKQRLTAYNLPEVKVKFYPAQVWDYEVLNPLEVTAGGLNRYHYSWYVGQKAPDFRNTWQYQRRHGYYQLSYADSQQLIGNTTLTYEEKFQQDVYSGGYFHWGLDTSLTLDTQLPFNWENSLTCDHYQDFGFVPKGFQAKNPQRKLEEELSWRQGKSNFELATGYDFLTHKYDDLTSSLNYTFNRHYETELTSCYNLNESRFEDFSSSLWVTYDNFTYGTTAELNLNTGRPISWENSLDWKFGREDWKWQITAKGDYDFKAKNFTTATIKVEKKLHCRKLVVSYDHLQKEVWFQYQILAFGQSKANVGVKKEEGILFGGELGRLIDEEN